MNDADGIPILFVLREWQLVLQMEWFNGNFQYYSKKLS